ncbi:MAG: hypothetical protein R2759_07920 [Bacteroidales bacterium]
MEYTLGAIIALVVILFATMLALFSRYKRCPSDKILVIYGKTGKTKEGTSRSSRTIHGEGIIYMARNSELCISGSYAHFN